MGSSPAATNWFFTSPPHASASLQHPPSLLVPEQHPIGADVEAVALEAVVHQPAAQQFSSATQPAAAQQQSAEREPGSQESDNLRSPEAIVEERSKKCPQWDFGETPMQCFATEGALIDAIIKNTKNHNTDGGGHGIPRGLNSQKTYKGKGNCRLLQCDKSGEFRGKRNTGQRETTTKKCNCKWGMWIEQSSDGWMFACPSAQAVKDIREKGGDCDFNSSHSHPLFQTLDECNTDSTLRGLNAAQHSLAEILSRAGNTPTQIFHTLQRECKHNGEDVTFTAKDISNLFATPAAEKALDCSNLLEHLHDRFIKDSTLPNYNLFAKW
jgi:hypothetical protein